MKPSSFSKNGTFYVFSLFILLAGCDPGVIKFQEAIEQDSPAIQALATAFEKKLKTNILDQAFDLQHSTRVVFSQSGQLTQKQLSLISPAAAVAILSEDTLSQISSAQVLDSLLGAVLLGNMLTDTLSTLPSDKKVTVTKGEFLIDNNRTYIIKKLESTKGQGYVNRFEIVLKNSNAGDVKMVAYSMSNGVRNVTLSIKKSSKEMFFIEAHGKAKQSGLVFTLLNYEVKRAAFQVKDKCESKSGVSLLSLITSQIISGSDISVSDVLDLAQSDDVEMSGPLDEIISERNGNHIYEEAVNWQNSSRFTFTKEKPLNETQKKLMPLVALTALLAKDTSQMLDTGRIKEVTLMLSQSIPTIVSEMTSRPSSNTSITQGKVKVDGESSFKFVSANLTKKNSKTTLIIEFDYSKKGSVSLEITVPTEGLSSAIFSFDDPASNKSIVMKGYASGDGSNIKHFATSISKGTNLVSNLDINHLGMSFEDLIRDYLMAGNAITIEELKNLFEIEKTFSGSIEEATGDLAQVVSDFDLGSVRVQFTGTDNVIFSYKPGDVEYTVTGIINGSNIQIPETSLQEANFVSETLGKCTINDAKISGDCTIQSQNTISCGFILTGDVVDSSPAYCFIPKDNSETQMDVVFTVN